MFVASAIVLVVLSLAHPVKSAGCLPTFMRNFLTDRPVWIVHASNGSAVINEAFQMEHPTVLLNVTKAANFATFDKAMDKEVNYIIAADLNSSLEHLKTNSMWRSKSKHLVFVEEKVNKTVAKRVFKKLWESDVYNAAIVKQSSARGFVWYPYKSGSNCGTTVNLKSFNICSTNFDPFAGKIPKKFHGCSVNVAWYKSSFADIDPSRKEHRGVLVDLLRQVQKNLGLNMKYDFAQNINEITNRTALATGKCSTSEMLRAMEANKIEILLHIFIPLACKEVDRFEISASFYFVEFLWVVPHREPLPTWILFQKIFNPREYFFLVLIYLLLVVLWKSTNNSSTGSSFFSITKLFLFQNVGNISTCTRIIIFITGNFLTLHISYVFSSRLYSVLTTPLYDPSPSTLSQLVDSDIEFYHDPVFYNQLKSTNTALWKKIQKKTVNIPGRKWQDQINGTLAFPINSINLFYTKNKEEMEILPDRVR